GSLDPPYTAAESEGAMCDIRKTAFVFALGPFLVAGFIGSAQKDAPAPPEKGPGLQAFPKQCEGFLKTDRTRLAGVLGKYKRVDSISAVAFSADRRYALVATVQEEMPDDQPGADDLAALDFHVTLWDTTTDEAVRTIST